MNIPSALRPAVPALLFSLLLAGCASAGGPHAHQGGMMGGQGGMMDMQAMCDMHKQEMAGKSPAEQRAIIEERMRSMSPEMQERAKRMMEQCK